MLWSGLADGVGTFSFSFFYQSKIEMPGLGRKASTDETNATEDQANRENGLGTQGTVEINNDRCRDIDTSTTDTSDPGQGLTCRIRKSIVCKKEVLEDSPDGVHAKHPFLKTKKIEQRGTMNGCPCRQDYDHLGGVF